MSQNSFLLSMVVVGGALKETKEDRLTHKFPIFLDTLFVYQHRKTTVGKTHGKHAEQK